MRKVVVKSVTVRPLRRRSALVISIQVSPIILQYCCGFEFTVALTDALLRWKTGARGPVSVEAMLHA